MKLVSGLPVALAAEHRAIVGELAHNLLVIPAATVGKGRVPS